MMGRACGTAGEKANAYGALVKEPEGKSPPARPRHRYEDTSNGS